MYTIEQKYVNTNSMTNGQAEAYYSVRRVVINIFDHWWGLPQNRAKTPMAIYNYMVSANKSVNFILGWDDAQKKVRIIAMTPLNRVALTQQNGNPTGVSIEVDPLITTNDPKAYELYKALGWLHVHIEKQVGRGQLPPKLHKEVWATQCSNIDKNRVTRERNKWVSGGYDPKKPQPPVQGAKIKYVALKVPKVYYAYEDIKLWEFNHTKHSDMKLVTTVRKPSDQLEIPITIVGYAINESVGGSKYMMTEYSFGEHIKFDGKVNKTTGFNIVDLHEEPVKRPTKPPVVVVPVPIPPDVTPVPVPEPVPPVVEPIPIPEPPVVVEPTPEPVEPVTPPSEAAISAAKMLARLGTQLAAAKILVEGVVTLLNSYDLGITIGDRVEGIAVVAVAVATVFISQFGYKLKTRFKWFF